MWPFIVAWHNPFCSLRQRREKRWASDFHFVFRFRGYVPPYEWNWLGLITQHGLTMWWLRTIEYFLMGDQTSTQPHEHTHSLSGLQWVALYSCPHLSPHLPLYLNLFLHFPPAFSLSLSRAKVAFLLLHLDSPAELSPTPSRFAPPLMLFLFRICTALVISASVDWSYLFLSRSAKEIRLRIGSLVSWSR